MTKIELVHPAAVGIGHQIAEEARLFRVANNTVNLVVIFQVGAQAVQEHRQAFMRQAAGSDPPG